MLNATTVSLEDELLQIYHLSQKNLKQHLSVNEKNTEGFVSWSYPLDLLQLMNNMAPSIIVKDEDKVAGYALTTLKESAAFHPDLRGMIQHLQQVNYKNKSLLSYRFYCMGQICIDKDYRGKGVFNLLYQKHKEVYSRTYDMLITEISTSNLRSQKAHEKTGFKTIHTHTDEMDEWNIVVWDWS